MPSIDRFSRVITGKNEVALWIGADDDAARPADTFDEVPDRLARPNMQLRKWLRVELSANGNSNAIARERRQDSLRGLKKAHAVEVAGRIEMRGARRQPRHSAPLELNLMMRRIIRGLTGNDDAGHRKLTTELDLHILARQIHRGPAAALHILVLALNRLELETWPRFRIVDLHLDAFPRVRYLAGHNHFGNLRRPWPDRRQGAGRPQVRYWRFLLF